MRGIAYLYSDTRAYLSTHGLNEPRLDTYPGWEGPNPRGVSMFLHGNALLEPVLSDVMGLTRLNYRAEAYSATLPVTRGFADAVPRDPDGCGQETDAVGPASSFLASYI